MGTPSGETKLKERQSYCQGDFLCFFHCVTNPAWGCRAQELGKSPRGTLNTTDAAVCETLPKGEVSTSVLPEWE